MNTIQAKKISIIDFLSTLGHVPSKVKGNQLYYLSPLRKELEPSFFVNRVKNLWFDFGRGSGGTIIDLVLMMKKADSISEALKYLQTLNLAPQEKFNQIENGSKFCHPSQILISEILPLGDLTLLEYIRSRKISLDIAKNYCFEMHYQVGFKKFKAIAFPNEAADGFALRSPNFKGCTLQNISIVPGTDSNNKNCLLFEGFFDYLSYLTLKNEKQFEATSIVLNSNSNLEKAIKFIKENQLKPSLLLDNDKGGKYAVKRILTEIPEGIDFSSMYSEYKDLNEYLINFRN